jgi:DNA segregation ATPase FtsK/SpoIIIE-like protein
MGAETPPTEEGTPEIAAGGSPEIAEGSLMVLADALSAWPASLLERLRQQGPLTVLHADDPLEDTAPPGRLLLGYRDPRSGLAEALARDAAPDLATLLGAWQRSAERMLQLRQQPGPPVVLIALDRLDGAAEAALLERLAPEGQPAALGDEAAPDPDADPIREPPPSPAPPGPALPTVVAHYLAQRPEIYQLLADLEGCAELLGRDPQLPVAAPPERGLVLAQRLLHDWLALRAAHHQELERLARERELLKGELATTSGVLADVVGLHQQTEAEAEALRRQLEHQANQLEGQAQRMEEERQALHTEQVSLNAKQESLEAEWAQQLEESRLRLEETHERLAEEEARQRDGEEERELILLQLKQVQDELTHTFQELTQARRGGEALAERLAGLEERLAGLEEECRTLFLHSRLTPQIDRTKIATILQLVRENLRV